MGMLRNDSEFCPKCQSEAPKVEGENYYRCSICNSKFSKKNAPDYICGMGLTSYHSNLFGPITKKMPGCAYAGKRQR